MSTLRCFCVLNKKILLKPNVLKVHSRNLSQSFHSQRLYVLDNVHVLKHNKNKKYGLSVISRNFGTELVTAEAPQVLESSLSEPTFQSIGLGGSTPSGLVQQGLEFLHVNCDLPWWGCIAIGTCAIRLFILPLAIASQRNMAVMNNTMPQLQLLQLKMSEARKRGNPIEATQYSREMMALVKEKNINPLKSFMIPMVQMPVFLSFFFALRGMAELPVDSLHQGGLLWFSDLTIPDPYYMLPLITSITMFVTVELGLDTGMTPSQMQNDVMKYIFRAFPVILFPVTMQFPGIILVYWVSTNFISLIQMKILRIDRVREYFGIEKIIPFKMNFQMPKINKGFTESFKESFTNMSISHEIQERERITALEKQQKRVVKKKT